ncbi:hypothetical protein [Nocardiopsis sp. NRRL B-16309]|uniref:hypothetical protein n=1 Tax=Nocardiopsis sp. NRRL B-16309 TaxID=1519494 RepID=UPI0009E9F633|nr:hypothetical protein [Nocardiopsis sp. NRRL B-16309]
MKSGRSNLYQSLYKTKLTLLAVIAIVVGTALLLLSAWAEQQPGWELLSAAVVNDVGVALLTTGLVVIAFEYINREHGEAQAMHRLRQVVAEQAPAIRDAVIQGFAFNADDLARVSSPEVLDQIVRNSLAIQLKDRQLAEDVYTDLRQQVIRAPERWHDVHVSVALDPWKDGPAAGVGSMFVATVRWEYRVVPSSSVMRFSAVSDLDDYRTLLDDPTTTGAWYFEPIANLNGASPESFELVQFTVNGEERRIRRSSRKDEQTYTVDTGVAAGSSEEAKISYTYRALVQKNSHLLAIDFPRPAKGVKVELWYGNSGIRHMTVLDPIASAQKSHITQRPDSVPTSTVEVGFDGWIFPRSGVVFVWVLEGEIDTKPSPEAKGKSSSSRSV